MFLRRNIQDGVVDGFLDVFGAGNLKVAYYLCPVFPDVNTSTGALKIGFNAVRFIRYEPYPLVKNKRNLKNITGQCLLVKDKVHGNRMGIERIVPSPKLLSQ